MSKFINASSYFSHHGTWEAGVRERPSLFQFEGPARHKEHTVWVPKTSSCSQDPLRMCYHCPGYSSKGKVLSALTPTDSGW